MRCARQIIYLLAAKENKQVDGAADHRWCVHVSLLLVRNTSQGNYHGWLDMGISRAEPKKARCKKIQARAQPGPIWSVEIRPKPNKARLPPCAPCWIRTYVKPKPSPICVFNLILRPEPGLARPEFSVWVGLPMARSMDDQPLVLLSSTRCHSMPCNHSWLLMVS